MPEFVQVISLVNQIQGMSYYGYNSFIGFTASNVKLSLLSQLDDYLRSSFENTDRNVFIIEKSSGYLIASSLGAKTYVSINGVNVS